MTKNTYLEKNSIDINTKKLKTHLDVWNINDNLNSFEAVTMDFQQTGEKRMTDLNQFTTLFNARILGFTPKEILILHFWNRFNERNEIAKQLNNRLKKEEFSPKNISDFIYKLSNKIIKTYKANVLLDEIPEKEQLLLNRNNAMKLAVKLGLLRFQESTIDSII